MYFSQSFTKPSSGLAKGMLADIVVSVKGVWVIVLNTCSMLKIFGQRTVWTICYIVKCLSRSKVKTCISANRNFSET